VPTILRIQGFRVYFWSREPSEPPHVHLDKGGPRRRYAGAPSHWPVTLAFRPTSWVLFCDWFASSNLRCWRHGMSSSAQAEGADIRVRAVTVSEDELTVH